jgi:ribosomal protein S27E
MYTEGRDIKKDESKPKPFTIKCNCCGDTDVTATAWGYYYLEIECKNCGAYLSYGSYREKEYGEED